MIRLIKLLLQTTFLYLVACFFAENMYHNGYMNTFREMKKYNLMFRTTDEKKWHDLGYFVLEMQQREIRPEPDILNILSIYKSFTTTTTIPDIVDTVKVIAHSNRKYMTNMSLEKVDLSSTDRIRDFSSSIFSHSKMINANLSKTNFKNSNFVDVDLSDANLSNADLTGANLTRANLKGADLRGTKFDHSVLLGTDMTDAITDEHTSFKDVTYNKENLIIIEKKIEINNDEKKQKEKI